MVRTLSASLIESNLCEAFSEMLSVMEDDTTAYNTAMVIMSCSLVAQPVIAAPLDLRLIYKAQESTSNKHF